MHILADTADSLYRVTTPKEAYILDGKFFMYILKAPCLTQFLSDKVNLGIKIYASSYLT